MLVYIAATLISCLLAVWCEKRNTDALNAIDSKQRWGALVLCSLPLISKCGAVGRGHRFPLYLSAGIPGSAVAAGRRWRCAVSGAVCADARRSYPVGAV